MSKIVQVKLNRGISSIKNKMSKKGKGVNFFRVGRYTQKKEDRDESGSRMGDYGNEAFPRVEQPQLPTFCGVKKQYRWAGTEAKFIELVNSINMKYPKSYRDESLRGAFIRLDPKKDAGTLESRLHNYSDPIFTNTIFRDTVKLYEGSAVWNLANPIFEFMHLTTIDRIDVSTKERQRKGAALEIRDLKVDNNTSARSVEKNLKSSQLFQAIFDDEVKMRQIAFILKAKGVGKNTEFAALKIIMHDIIIHNDTQSASYGKSYQDAFIELCEMKGADLEVQYEISFALSKRIIKKKSDRFEFRESTIPVKTRSKLIEYFLKEENTSLYMDLKAEISDAKS